MGKTLTIDICETKYDVRIGTNILLHSKKYIDEVTSASKVFIVTDDNVAPLYLDIFSKLFEGKKLKVYIIKAGELSKNFSEVQKIIDDASEFQLSRTDVFIALGGGVVGDLCGFVSSIYLRGIPFIQVPTTLLAQVDSSVGGKVGINISCGKNLVGSFYQPKLVISDISVLSTLSQRDFNGGMAEIIKYGCIYDDILFHKLSSEKITENVLEDIIYDSCRIKNDYVQKDPYDIGERMQLNFGHTLGHAIENISGYGEYHHGEAISIGMAVATLFGEEIGITKRGTYKEIVNILSKYSLPYEINRKIINDLEKAFYMDKKNLYGKLNFVFIEQIGKAVVREVSVNEFYSWIKRLNGG